MLKHVAIAARATPLSLNDTTLLGDVLESSTSPILVASPSLRVLHANTAAARLFRPAVPQDDGLHLADFCGPDNLFLCELIAGAVRNEEALTGRNISIDGDVFDLSVHRGEAAWIVTLRPVTRELSRDYRLKQLEGHMHILLRAINGIEGSVIIVDIDGRIRFLNDYTRRHVGDLLKDVDIADWPAAAGFYREDGVTPLEGPDRILPRALKGQTIINQPIVVRNDLTGVSVHIRASATPIISRKNGVVGAIGWFHDATDSRALDAYRSGEEALDKDMAG
ncbi:MAG: PAS domain-containing protein [Parvibaculum sp.]